MSAAVKQTIIGALCLTSVMAGVYVVSLVGHTAIASTKPEPRVDPYEEAGRTMPCDLPVVAGDAQLVRCQMKRTTRDLHQTCVFRVPRESCSDGVGVIAYTASASCTGWNKIWDGCRAQFMRSIKAYAEN